MNRAREAFAADLESACWPIDRLGDALAALASFCGRAAPQGATSTTNAADSAVDELMHALTAWAGFEAVQVFAGLDELDSMLVTGAPMAIRIPSLPGHPFLIIAVCGRGSVLALGPDGRRHSLPVARISDSVRTPFEQPATVAVSHILDRLALQGCQRRKTQAVLRQDRLATARFGGCWLLRLPPGSQLRNEAKEARVWQRLATVGCAYAGQYALFIASWWILGHVVLNGAADRGWLLGWLLLLISVIPLRMAVTWQQGLLAVSIGAWIRRRLLRGAFHIDRQHIKSKGVGQLFSVVVEAAAIDGMALTGGLAAAFALLELLGAMIVLWWGASLWPVAALAACVPAALFLAWRYYRRRVTWTTQRLGMSHHLLEAMMGHRTRLAQQPAQDRHLEEDRSLDETLMLGQRMDAASLWLTAVLPRAWLIAGLTVLLFTTANVSYTQLAVSVGGLLLAYRALQRLASGVASLAGAIVAGKSVTALALAATPGPAPLLPLLSARRRTVPAGSKEPVLQARDLVFRYRSQADAVIAGATMDIDPGARLLLEGASGAGKTTFATLLAGFERPEVGLLLAGGLDRAALGPRGWSSRIVMAPQIHDNHLLGGTLAFNLLMGRRWPAEAADLREAETVCRDLGLGDLLERLPGGLDQVVGETGWQLSQGERVRVFLARALLQKPDLLILDESFSALDPENLDRAVRTVAAQGSAVLAIAHL